MTPERWQEIQEVFARAVARPPPERSEYLDGACGADTDLRQEVDSLLLASDETDDFLEQPVADLRVAHSGGPDPSLEPGDRIGPWRVVEPIGKGGMGRVVLAERADGEFDQQVAIKILEWGSDSEELVTRFRFERRILAQLAHPNIAKLFDGGTTRGGLPFFVMEHVRGEPIDVYCRRRELGLEERLQLFRKVCAAVSFAHRNLVVHRDLKPGNILVDAEGEPKLLDFGIAKLVQGGKEATDATALGRGPMTPAYASPEQILGAPITTSSDVYSLGILLYELLTGNNPFREVPSPTGRRQHRRHLQLEEDPPEKPSTAFRRRASGRRAVDADPGFPPGWQSGLKGDLDSIVLMALDPEPQRRYASVEQLGNDLERFLTGLPVLARPGTWSYQLGKLVRRHLWESVLGALLLVLALGAGWVNWTLKNEAEQERDRAEVVNNFLLDLFALPDPRRYAGETVTAHRLLDAASDAIRNDLEEQPDDRATLMASIGSAYLGLQLYAEAEPLLRESLARRRDDIAAVAQRRELVVLLLNLATALRHLDGDDEASSLDHEALGLLTASRLDQPRLAAFLNNQATLRQHRGVFDSAEALYRESLRMRTRLHGANAPELARVSGNFASFLAERGQLDEAERHFRRTLALHRRHQGPVSLAVATAMNNLATLLRDRGDLEGAEPLFLETLEIRRQLSGEESWAVGVGLNNLGLLRLDQGRGEQAVDLLQQGLERARAAFGPDHPNTATLLRNLAAARLLVGDLVSAEQEAGEALRVFRATWGDEHWRVADVHSLLGEARLRTGRTAEGLALLEASRNALDEALGPGARQTQKATARLARWKGSVPGSTAEPSARNGPGR